jgi:hypothetical protein
MEVLEMSKEANVIALFPDAGDARLKRRPLNDLSYIAVDPVSPHCGWREPIILTPDEAALYDVDPDGWSAQHFGLTLDQYYEWVESGGVPFCGAITKAGKPCRNPVFVCEPLDAKEWLSSHRNYFCNAHQAKATSA